MKLKKSTQAHWLLGLLLGAVALSSSAQTSQDLLNDAKTPKDVLVYGMGYNAQRFSSLDKINKGNVKKLVPIWSYSMNDMRGAEAFPVIRDGVIYTTTHNSTTAVDALTGKSIWRVSHD